MREISITVKQINIGKTAGPDDISAETGHRTNRKYTPRPIQEDLGGTTGATDRLEIKTTHQVTKEGRYDQL
ncbi:unnamed protein product [Schistosoma mattheei]|uniref:Uncharacterized protein n=1 Tax=Schistosoma mattheei TaxID=31246 RepID=A0A183NTH7_9TREM|nr:unnamed protein product [Schistosoma mattheei]